MASWVKLFVKSGVVPMALRDTSYLELIESLFMSVLGWFMLVIVLNILKSLRPLDSESKGRSDEGLLESNLL